MKPTSRCLLLFLLGLAVALTPVLLGPRLWTLWLAYVGALLLVAGIDVLVALPRRALTVRVDVPDQVFIGGEADALVSLESARLLPRTTVEVLLDLGGDVLPHTSPERTTLEDGRGRVRVPLVPHRRGRIRVDRAWLRWSGPLGLMQRTMQEEVGVEVPVVPDVRRSRGQALAFFRARDPLVGLKVVRHVGEGSEFEALRDYVPGFDPRSISWRASARHRKLIAQEYRAERNHQVVIAVDTGHLMREPLRGIPKLDHAVTGALALAYTCLRTGDRVGFYAFDSKVRAYAAPRGGIHAFGRMQHLSADLAYSTEETNFTLGLAELSTRLTRRSMVVLLTDFVDTVTAELMVENVGRLGRRHLVTFVTLRDPGLEATVDEDPSSLGALYEAVVAGDFVQERDLVLLRLQRLGVHCIDAVPDAVSTRLLNRYFDVKRRELV